MSANKRSRSHSLLVTMLGIFPLFCADAWANSTPLAAHESAQIDAAIECLNGLTGRAHQAIERYHSWVDVKNGPRGSERPGVAIYGLPLYPLCHKAATGALAVSGPSRIEPALKAFLAAAGSFAETLDQADRYYTSKDYLDDNMARGRELHPQIEAGFEAFESARMPLYTIVKGLEGERETALIAQLEREGKFEGVARKAINQAEELLRTLGDPDGTRIALPAFTEQVGRMQTAVEAVEQRADKHNPLGYQEREFAKRCRELLSTAKGMARRLKAGRSFSNKEGFSATKSIHVSSQCTISSDFPACLLMQYRDLVDYFNKGHFDRS